MAQLTLIKADGLPNIEFHPDENGGTDFYSNGGRFMSLNPAGGHWEITIHKSLPEGTALEIDADGFPVVHED